jgi:hypothetical protein
MLKKSNYQEVNIQDNQMLFYRAEGWGTVPSTLEQAEIALQELNSTDNYPDYYRDWLRSIINKEFGVS